jgi:vacuolar-type H+-ATPase subunit I/STV1
LLLGLKHQNTPRHEKLLPPSEEFDTSACRRITYLNPHIIADMEHHLALIATILAGFAFTFISALFSSNNKSTVANLTYLATLVAVLCFLICAIGWTFIAMQSPTQNAALTSAFHKPLSLSLIIGIAAVLCCLAFAGWIRSKWVGILSTAFSLIAAIFIFSLLSHIIH